MSVLNNNEKVRRVPRDDDNGYTLLKWS